MKKHSAFTLIELLIVVAIIAILAAIAVPNFLEAQTRSKVSRSLADMRSLATAIEAYAVDNNKYPDVAVADIPVPPGPPIKLGIGYSRACFERISTPIAYITTGKLIDPFAIGTPDTTFFGYANCKEAYQSGALAAVGVGSPSDEDLGLFLVHAYVLQGVGPDRLNFPLQGTATQNFPLAFSALTNKLDTSFFYDATNGTVSVGDVVRTAAIQKPGN